MAGSRCFDLGSNEEIYQVCKEACSGDEEVVRYLSKMLEDGRDPLGDAFMKVNPPSERRVSGCTYTPPELVSAMVCHAARSICPDVVVDCGCGSGRFALAAAQAFPSARVLAVDASELACDMCRANVRACGLEGRVEVICGDFTEVGLRRGEERILWIGNPPYVRHHGIDASRKAWFKDACRSLGVGGSGLSGLHAHFLARIAQDWREGDYGVLVLSAEWLDVNYGRAMRELLTGMLRLDRIDLLDRKSEAFDGTLTTSVIIGFGGDGDAVRVGSGATRSVDVPRSVLRDAPRWSPVLLHGGAADGGPCLAESELVPLGSLARVHRGVVTGNNSFWVREKDELGDVPESLTVPVVSHARELTGDCMAKSNPDGLRRLIVLPEDIGELSASEARAARSLIADGEQRGVDKGYIARHRKAWWSVKPQEAPAVLMTYMGRSTPTFVINENDLTMLNVVHGLYPVKPLSDRALERLVSYLNENVTLDEGRMYCGGLVKFEPREAEAIPVPSLKVLEA